MTSSTRSEIQKSHDTKAAAGQLPTGQARPREHKHHANPPTLSSKDKKEALSGVSTYRDVVLLMVFMLNMTKTSSSLVMDMFFQERDDFLMYHISTGGGHTNSKKDVESDK